MSGFKKIVYDLDLEKLKSIERAAMKLANNGSNPSAFIVEESIDYGYVDVIDPATGNFVRAIHPREDDKCQTSEKK